MSAWTIAHPSGALIVTTTPALLGGSSQGAHLSYAHSGMPAQAADFVASHL